MTKNKTANQNKRTTFSLSTKLILGAMGLTLATVITITFAIYISVSKRIEKESKESIKMAVNYAKTMVDQSASHTIEGQLQATANRNKEIVAYFYKEFKNGILTEERAKELVKQTLLSQKIGKTGYLYIIDSTGTLRVHPKKELVDQDISDNGFVQTQIEQKKGYIKYKWKNPDEKEKREKVLAMSYFEPWDYIISASAYKNEFLSIFDLKKFKKEILSMTFNNRGYMYIMDTKGNLLIHPEMEGQNIFDKKDASNRYFIREICKKKNGEINYPWKNPGESNTREKKVIFKHYPDLDIIVVGGIYLDRLYEPLHELRNVLLLITLIIFIIAVPIAIIAARTIAKPVLRVTKLSQKIADKDLSAIADFDEMESTQQKGKFRLLRGSTEILVLLRAFRDAGLSIRSLLAKLNTNADNLTNQAEIIDDAAKFSNNSAADQSAMVEEVSQTIESLQNTFQRTEQIATDVYTVSEQAVRKGAEGNMALKSAKDSMDTIIKTTDSARQQMAALDDLSNQIAQVVKSLEQIADSSQMLAINASIEAAEAGEAGQGFAVVASEVQELAIQSAKSTQNIRSFLQQIADSSRKAIKLTEDSQIAVSEGQTSISGIETVLHSLTHVLDSNNQNANQISKTVAEQSSSISQISYAVNHVLQSSQDSSQNVNKLIKAVEKLNLTRIEFEKLVRDYKV